LNLPHESELWGRFLHNCALCDGDVYGSRGSRSIKKGGNASNDEKSVVVIGGGDAAVEAVSLLARIGVHTIHWIHRREEFRANAAEVEKVRNLPNVQTWTSFVVVEWVVKESSISDGARKVLDGVRIIGSIDGVADPGATSSLTIPCDGAFLMIGSDPNTKWLKTSGMDIDSAGLIRLQSGDATNHDNLPFLSSQTSIPGVFAAGEAVDGIYRQALTAASDGAKSAMDAERYLRFSGTVPDVLATRGRFNASQNEPAADDKENDDQPGLRINCDFTQISCITQTVSEHPVVIFGKSFCSYCHRAAEALEAEGVTPLVFQLDYMGKNGRKVQDTLEEMTGRRTVPNVFVGGKTIGGGTETVELHQSGKLRTLLQEAGAFE
jgi:glutaredoxin